MTQPLKPFRGNPSDADIARLREFVEIVAAGGITAAQARLGKGKSAISLGLTRVEELHIRGGRAANMCYLIHRKARPLGLGSTIFRGILIDELLVDQ